MTRVVFVGEMYNADLSVGGGPVYPSGPVDPGYSPPWARPRPPYVDNTLPRPPGPVDPGYSPPWARPPVDPGWSGGVAPPNVIGGGPIYPSGPVDPGYSPPWATPGPGRPVDPGYSPPWAQAPVDPGYSPPWARPQPPGIWGGPWLPPYVDNTLPIIPPQQPIIDPINPGQAHLVAYTPKAGGGYERTTFTVTLPDPTTPTEPAPKV